MQELLFEWLGSADRDVALCRLVASAGEHRLLTDVGFHAQQAVEKYIKAYLVGRQVEFPKTHDLEKLLAMMHSKNPALADALLPAVELNRFAVGPAIADRA